VSDSIQLTLCKRQRARRLEKRAEKAEQALRDLLEWAEYNVKFASSDPEWETIVAKLKEVQP